MLMGSATGIATDPRRLRVDAKVGGKSLDIRAGRSAEDEALGRVRPRVEGVETRLEVADLGASVARVSLLLALRASTNINLTHIRIFTE